VPRFAGGLLGRHVCHKVDGPRFGKPHSEVLGGGTGPSSEPGQCSRRPRLLDRTSTTTRRTSSAGSPHGVRSDSFAGVFRWPRCAVRLHALRQQHVTQRRNHERGASRGRCGAGRRRRRPGRRAWPAPRRHRTPVSDVPRSGGTRRQRRSRSHRPRRPPERSGPQRRSRSCPPAESGTASPGPERPWRGAACSTHRSELDPGSATTAG
jgi:hypothetical protein